MTIERTRTMKVHKNLVILMLRSHPEDREQLIPDWPGTVEEYIAELERRPGEYFIGGVLEESGLNPD